MKPNEGSARFSIRSRMLAAGLCLTSLLASGPARGNGENDPYWAGLLSELVPGGGYAYLGDWRSGLLAGALLIPIASEYYIDDLYYSQAVSRRSFARLADGIYDFTVYDSYQDGLDRLGRPAQIVDVPHYSMKDLFLAHFELESYQGWKVWLGLGVIAGAVGYTLGTGKPIGSGLSAGQIIFAVPTMVAAGMFVGVTEEAEYRGYQFPAFSKLTGSATAGGILSSVSFGLSHLPFGFVAPYPLVPVIALTGRSTERYDVDQLTRYDAARALWSGTFGLYASWLTANEPNGFKKAILLHGLADGLLFASQYLTQEGQTDYGLSFSISLP